MRAILFGGGLSLLISLLGTRYAIRFFTRQGFSLRRIPTTWRFPDRATCEAVLRIEFSSAVADRALAQCTGLTIPVGYRLHVRHKRLAP